MLSLEDVRIEETGGNAVMPHGMRISYLQDPTLFVIGNCKSEQSKPQMQMTLMNKLTEIVASAEKRKPKPEPLPQSDDETIYLREQLAKMQAQLERLSAGRTEPKKRGRPPKQKEAA